MRVRLSVVWTVLGGIAIACGGTPQGFDRAGATAGEGDPSNGGAASGLVQPPPKSDTEESAAGHLHGTVVAPEGTIPVSGALLYLTSTPPPPIPDGTYCDRCVQLTKANPFTYSMADGTFVLPSFTTGPQYLVVQKGAFRRVRKVTVTGGEEPVAPEFTRLPGRTDKTQGDDIPRMAVAWGGSFDKIENSLVKLGIDKSAFDVYGSSFFGQPDGAQLIQDSAKLSQYQIVFLPCNGWDVNTQTCTDTKPRLSSVQNALRDFVAKGGKLYATDFGYNYVDQVFPGYISWQSVNGKTGYGAACTGKEYDANANVNDPGLNAWLTAIGDSSVQLKGNYVTIRSVQPASGLDNQGQPATITPKVWVDSLSTAGKRPATVSFEHGCGRVMYSTYHTEGSHDHALLPQEKALLYVLLEVGVCVGPMPGQGPPR